MVASGWYREFILSFVSDLDTAVSYVPLLYHDANHIVFIHYTSMLLREV
jgi:hypothetical protein